MRVARGATRPEFGVPVLGDDGHAEEISEEEAPPSGFHVNVPFPAGATVVQLRVGADVKYCRAAQPGDVPDVSNVTPGTSPDTGTLLRSFPLPQPSGGTQVNGRAIAFDGRDLWATFGPNSSNAMDGKLYKVTTTGTLLRTDNISTPLGALAYDAERGTLYGGHYDLANRKPQLAGNVYEITTGTSPTVTKLFRYPFTGGTTCAGGDPKAINGLEDLARRLRAQRRPRETGLHHDAPRRGRVVVQHGRRGRGLQLRNRAGPRGPLARLARHERQHDVRAHVEDGCPRRGEVHGSRLQGAGHRVRRRHLRAEVRPLDEPGDQYRAAGPGLPGAVRHRSDLQVQRERAGPRRNRVLHVRTPRRPPLSDCVEPPRHRPDRRHLHLHASPSTSSTRAAKERRRSS